MLLQLTTERADLPYVSKLLEEVKAVLTEAVAGSTTKGYSGHWKCWVAFAEEQGLVSLPAHLDHLCAHFLHLCMHRNSLGTALSARAAIGFFHKLSLPQNSLPTDCVRVSMCFAGLKKHYAKPPVKAIKFPLLLSGG